MKKIIRIVPAHDDNTRRRTSPTIICFQLRVRTFRATIFINYRYIPASYIFSRSLTSRVVCMYIFLYTYSLLPPWNANNIRSARKNPRRITVYTIPTYSDVARVFLKFSSSLFEQQL